MKHAGNLHLKLLRLYPRSYRTRFGAEWLEAYLWRRTEWLGRPGGRLRFNALIALDSARSLPVAYANALIDWIRAAKQRQSSGGHSNGGHGPFKTGTRAPRVESIVADVTYAVRGLVKAPTFTLAAVLSLALGIGGATAIFSVVNAVLLRPLPYHEPGRLAMVWNEFPEAGLSRLPMSGVEILSLREHGEVFESVGGIWATSRTILTDGAPSQASAGLVTANLFDVLGVDFALGRSFPTDPDATGIRNAVISHELWTQHFGNDPEIIGSRMNIGGRDHEVVGVLPRNWKLYLPPDAGVPERLDLFTALPLDLSVLTVNQHFLRVVGRLRPGVTVEQARRAADAAATTVRNTYTELAASQDQFTVLPLSADSVRSIRPVLIVLLAGVGLMLLLASVNVASLVLARSSARRTEIALRACIGATGRRLFQQLAIESVMIAAIGGACGILLGNAAAEALWAARPEGLSRVDAIGLELPTLLFALGATSAATFIFGLTPLAQLRHASPAAAIKPTASTGRASQRSRRLLVVVEIGMALVLLIGAGLTGKTLTRLQQADVGFDPSQLLTFKIPLSSSRFPTATEKTLLVRQVEEQLGGLPGATAVGASSHVPFIGWPNWSDVAAPESVGEQDRAAFQVDHRSVTPGFFDALDATLLDGRMFTESDVENSEPVLIVDETYARRAFGNQSAIGRRVLASRYAGAGEFEPTLAVVVGLIADMRDRSPGEPSTGQVFWPFAQSARWELTFVVRSEGDPTALAEEARTVIAVVGGDLAPSDFATMDSYVETTTAAPRFTATLASVFSLSALVLAVLGLYGVVNSTTTQRAREFGIRMALGASRRRIIRNVLGEGLRLTVAGVALGIGVSFALNRFIAALLFGVSPNDPMTFGIISLSFLAVALTATFLPARKASRSNPASVLNEE